MTQEKIEQQPFTPEEPKSAEHKMEFSKVEDKEPPALDFSVPKGPDATPSNDELAEAANREAAFSKVSYALVKLGLSENDIEIAFGIPTKAARTAAMPTRPDLPPQAAALRKG